MSIFKKIFKRKIPLSGELALNNVDGNVKTGENILRVFGKFVKWFTITYFSTSMIILLITIIVSFLWAVIDPQGANDTIQNNTANYALQSSGVIDSLLDEFIKIFTWAIYSFLVWPLSFFLSKVQVLIDFMSGGQLLDNLLFQDSSKTNKLYWIMFGIGFALLVAFIGIKAIALMTSDNWQKGAKRFFKILIWIIILIPTIPLIFSTFNLLINLITQTIIESSGYKIDNLALLIFNSSFSNGIHSFESIPVGPFFSDAANFSPLICLFGLGIMIYVLILVNMYLFWRVAELVFLYITSPLVILYGSFDEGKSLLNWKDLVVNRFIGIVGTYITYSIFLWSMGIITSTGTNISDAGSRGLFNIIAAFSFGLVIVKSTQTINTIIGASSSLGDGFGNLMALKTGIGAIKTGIGSTRTGLSVGIKAVDMSLRGAGKVGAFNQMSKTTSNAHASVFKAHSSFHKAKEDAFKRWGFKEEK